MFGFAIMQFGFTFKLGKFVIVGQVIINSDYYLKQVGNFAAVNFNYSHNQGKIAIATIIAQDKRIVQAEMPTDNYSIGFLDFIGRVTGFIRNCLLLIRSNCLAGIGNNFCLLG